jgi:hypothetical protein
MHWYSYLHDSTAELSGALFVRRSQTKKREQADKLQIIRLQFVTRSLFDYFSSEFLESSIHRRICNMVC